MALSVLLPQPFRNLHSHYHAINSNPNISKNEYARCINKLALDIFRLVSATAALTLFFNNYLNQPLTFAAFTSAFYLISPPAFYFGLAGFNAAGSIFCLSNAIPDESLLWLSGSILFGSLAHFFSEGYDQGSSPLENRVFTKIMSMCK